MNEMVQFIAWFLALTELILAIYTLVLNPWHTSNRHLSVFLLIFSLNNFALGTLTGAQYLEQARQAAILLAATTPAIEPGLLIVSLVLFRPDWLSNRWRWIWWPFYGLVFLPGVLTLLDLQFGSALWYTGIDAANYSGGFLILANFTAGSLGPSLRTINFNVCAAAALLFLLYEALLDKHMKPPSRRLVWLLILGTIVAGGLQSGVRDILVPSVTVLLSSTVFVLAYGYASFQHIISERRYQRGRLQVRLTLLMLVITIPLVLGGILFVTERAGTLFRQTAAENLSQTNQSLASKISIWLDLQTRTLHTLSLQPDIISMDSARQTTVLKTLTLSHPHMYLASTTDLTGMNVARSDGRPPLDYSDRAWFQEVRAGKPAAYQTLIGRSSGKPAIVVAVPIHSTGGEIVGVVMFASELTALTKAVQASNVGESGYGFVVDEKDQVLAHPVLALERATGQPAELIDLSAYSPVAALRQGQLGVFRFTDENNTLWWAYLDRLDNGWGVIVQQPAIELQAPEKFFRRVALAFLAASSLLVLGLVWLSIRQSVAPIQRLTETAQAISGGDLSQAVPVEGSDELGVLARAFNSMTSQLRDLITGLEQRVTARTQELKRRAVQLQVAAEVAREAAAIHDLERLLEYAIHLISERFGFYHAAIFLTDSAREYAILRAASSDGGRRMLARRHQLKIGQTGIVGYVAAKNEPRIALDVGSDVTFFNNPDLPETRSEAAIPLNVRGSVIGVLDVQSEKASAFSQEDIEILQILADQLALAIENARLLEESQRAFQELDVLYGEHVRSSWRKQLPVQGLSYSYDRLEVRLVKAAVLPDDQEPNPHTLRAPIELRGQSLGTLVLRRDPDQAPWTPQEQALAQEALSQVALALENARLLEDVQRRALREQQINVINNKVSSSVHIETILQNTVRELGKALGASRTYIKIGSPRS